MVENWKDIPGYEGLYQVSDQGRVKSLERYVHHSKYDLKHVEEKILKPRYNGHGYLFVTLCKDNERKMIKIHRLVATAFIPNPLGLSDVNHINEDKSDNRVENLEWLSHKDNLNYGTRNARVAEAISKAVYCPELDMTFKSAKEAAIYVGCSIKTINNCLRGRLKHAGKHPVTGVRLTWQYKNEVA